MASARGGIPQVTGGRSVPRVCFPAPHGKSREAGGQAGSGFEALFVPPTLGLGCSEGLVSQEGHSRSLFILPRAGLFRAPSPKDSGSEL